MERRLTVRSKPMIHVSETRMSSIVSGLITRYMAQGITPDLVDLKHFKSQLAVLIQKETGAAFVDPSQIVVRMFRDVNDPSGRLYMTVDPLELT